MPRKTFSILSLGCFRNSYDSEIVTKRFLDKGYQLSSRINPFSSGIEDLENCDILIINTCGFIDKAKKESLEFIEGAVRLKNKGKVKKIIVFGCLVERQQKELEKFFPEVNEWLGVEEISKKFTKREKLFPAHIDFLKICEGCMNKCSYCAIPLIKGNLQSKPKEEIIKEAKWLDKKNVKELNIIGQDITSWGKDFSGRQNLTSLLKSILKETKNIKWIRLIYTHPRHITQALIDLIAKEERICKYIDLPIQHINDRILKLMNRGITKKEIVNLISRIRKDIPGCAIRTSVIVGFPTEAKAEFKELLDFLKEIRFDKLGAFTYSKEEKTSACNLRGHIPNRIKEKRFKEVMSLQRNIAQDSGKKFLGKEIDVLVEEKDNDIFVGRSQYDAHEVDGVVFLKKKRLKIGDFYKAKIVDSYDYDLVGI